MKLVHKVREYWRKLMDSNQKKMSRGAQDISTIITSANKDNWRRKDKVQNRPQAHRHKKDQIE